MSLIKSVALSACLLWPVLVPVAVAQDSVAEILEKARAEARIHNEYKLALNDPDPGVRLAVFNQMLQQDDPGLHKLAIETGLTSADSMMRSTALKGAVLSLTQLHIKLAVDPKSSPRQQTEAKKYLEQYGSAIALTMQKKDEKEGVFTASSWSGQVNNLQLLLLYSNINAVLTLQDDNSLKGTLNRSNIPYIASIDLF
ncbi:hypothetical protein [Pusillimonas sp. ANT_WB101]|uniref:hypothetical protein n=1 Tax=Pusillimonas sp. ANT_WB101 TaxID=2597356 RepID=UPI0011EBFB73|nr:hypothetical protein [Pusillimonas sp. ANT_WB101]KAA0911501.1 hypothetical protein FQ179_06660 [Pusillimonas sp. ANT_WB101]